MMTFLLKWWMLYWWWQCFTPHSSFNQEVRADDANADADPAVTVDHFDDGITNVNAHTASNVNVSADASTDDSFACSIRIPKLINCSHSQSNRTWIAIIKQQSFQSLAQIHPHSSTPWLTSISTLRNRRSLGNPTTSTSTMGFSHTFIILDISADQISVIQKCYTVHSLECQSTCAPMYLTSGLPNFCKFIYEWLPLLDQHHVHSNSLNNQCPLCCGSTETVTHFVNCPHPDCQKIWTNLHDPLYKLHLKQNVPPQYYNALAHGLYVGWGAQPPTQLQSDDDTAQKIQQDQE